MRTRPSIFLEVLKMLMMAMMIKRKAMAKEGTTRTSRRTTSTLLGRLSTLLVLFMQRQMEKRLS